MVGREQDGQTALPVHAFDQDQTLLGQGTVGMELGEQAPDIDTLLVGRRRRPDRGTYAAWYAGHVIVIGVEQHVHANS